MQLLSGHPGLGYKYSYDFQFTDIPNMWLSTDVTVQEAFEVLRTGLLRNRPVSKIKMFAINDIDSGGSISFVYDVICSKTGAFPWSLTSN